MNTSVIVEKDNDPTGGIEVVFQALTSKDSLFVLEQRYFLWFTLPGCICSASLDFGAGSANRSLFRPQE